MSLSEINETCRACEVEENLNILRERYLFSGLPIEVLKLLGYLCVRENFSVGDYLFNQGDDDGQAFYIMAGSASLVQQTNSEERILRRYQDGDFLGGLALVGHARRLFSLRAETPMVCLILIREKFTRVMEQFPDLMPKVFNAMVMRITTWEKRFLAKLAEPGKDSSQWVGLSLL